jgi:hypothetical protein
MPNHVYNTVTITAKTKEDLDAFLRKASAQEREFSYWNFITPPAEALASGEYWATRGWVAGKETGHTPNNWYEFNTREWGTKWDTYDLHVESAPKSFYATFSSAWSPPEPVFQAMTEQHPELTFSFSWEEEQGWGGEATGEGGEYSIDKEWDIPDSHADYVALDREDSCNCNQDDREYWYKDCPRAEVPEHEGCNCSHHQKEKVNG